MFRRAHARLKNIQHNQTIIELSLRSWIYKQHQALYNTGTTNKNIISTLNALKIAANDQLAALRQEHGALTLLQQHHMSKKDFVHKESQEIERIDEAIDHIEKLIVSIGQENIAMIDRLIQREQKSIFCAEHHDHDRTEEPQKNAKFLYINSESAQIKKHIREYEQRLIDVLHRPLYNGKTDYRDKGKHNSHQDSIEMMSTSLYSKRAQILREMAIYYPFTKKINFKPNDSVALANYFIFYTQFDEKYRIKATDNNFNHTADTYAALEQKLSQYNQYTYTEDDGEKEIERRVRIFQIHYLHLLDELNTLDAQINNHEQRLDSMEVLKAQFDMQYNPQEPQKTVSPITVPRENPNHIPETETADAASIFFDTKSPDSQTWIKWERLAKEFRGFFTTWGRGIGTGIKKLLTPDEKKYLYLTQQKKVSTFHPRLWGYHCKTFIKWLDKKSTTLAYIATAFYLIFNIPYFLYYGLKRLGRLWDNLAKVVNALHKGVRDIDQALSYAHGDNLFFAPCRYIARLVFSVITAIPMMLGGGAYWMLSLFGDLFLKTNNNIAQTAREIMHDDHADYIQRMYRYAREVYKEDGSTSKYVAKIALLYLATAFGFVYNIVWNILNKLPLWTSDLKDIQHSRTQLSTTGNILLFQIKTGIYLLFLEPVTSLWKQTLADIELVQARHHTAPIWRYASYGWLWVKFISFVLLNSITLGLLKTVLNILKTAPVVTAGVITTSTLFAGFTIPGLAVISFTGTPQMALGIAALAGDFLNGFMHDTYNLANTLNQTERMKVIEKAAHEKTFGKGEDVFVKSFDEASLITFNEWKEIFARVEDGKLMSQSIDDKYKNVKKGNYTYSYADKSKDALNALSHNHDENARRIIALHLAYFLINTADRDKDDRQKITDEQFMSLYDNLNCHSTLSHITQSIVCSQKYKNLIPKEKQHYLLGMAAHIGHLFAKQLVKQVHQQYRATLSYSLYLVDNTGKSIRGERDQTNPQQFNFADGITAIKMTLWEQFCYLFKKIDRNIMDGYKFTNLEREKKYYTAWMSPVHQVDLTKGLKNVAKEMGVQTSMPVVNNVGVVNATNNDNSNQHSSSTSVAKTYLLSVIL